MKIDINVDRKNYFYYRLRLLAPFKPFSILTNKERQLFALILNSYDLKKVIDKEGQDSLVFSLSNKKKMQQDLKMSKASFDNCMSSLRKKGFIRYRSLMPKYEGLINPIKELTFKFNIT